MKLTNRKKRLAFELQRILLSRAIYAICEKTGRSRESVFEWLCDGEWWNGTVPRK